MCCWTTVLAPLNVATIAYIRTGFMRCTLPALVFVLLTACTEHLPDIESTISKAARDADYPTLQPLPELITRSEAGSTVAVETEALERRVAALNH